MMFNKFVLFFDDLVWKIQNFLNLNNHLVLGLVIFFLILFSALGAKWLAVLIALIYIMIKVT